MSGDPDLSGDTLTVDTAPDEWTGSPTSAYQWPVSQRTSDGFELFLERGRGRQLDAEIGGQSFDRVGRGHWL